MRNLFLISVLVGSYILGSLNLAYFLARRSRGVDLRSVGSGNLGSGNLFNQVSKGIGVLVFVADCAKEAIPILTLRLTGFGLGWQAAAGLLVVAGHDWPFLMSFRGGRGMAMSLTGTLILIPWAGLAMVVLLTIGVTIHHLALLNLFALLIIPPLAWAIGQPLSLVLYGIGLLLMGMIRRVQGSPGLDGAVGEEDRMKVLWNRLIFDREREPQ